MCMILNCQRVLILLNVIKLNEMKSVIITIALVGVIVLLLKLFTPWNLSWWSVFWILVSTALYSTANGFITDKFRQQPDSTIDERREQFEIHYDKVKAFVLRNGKDASSACVDIMHDSYTYEDRLWVVYKTNDISGYLGGFIFFHVSGDGDWFFSDYAVPSFPTEWEIEEYKAAGLLS